MYASSLTCCQSHVTINEAKNSAWSKSCKKSSETCIGWFEGEACRSSSKCPRPQGNLSFSQVDRVFKVSIAVGLLRKQC